MKAGFLSLRNWFRHLEPNWDMIAGYYGSPVTSALSEGINNVIKTIKGRAYGYRNSQPQGSRNIADAIVKTKPKGATTSNLVHSFIR